jgi:hypothetical protein
MVMGPSLALLVLGVLLAIAVEALRLLLGAPANILPSVAPILAVLAALRGPAGRLRSLALGPGLVEGLFLERGLLVPAASALLLGWAASGLRRLWALRGPGRLFLLGLGTALAHAGLLVLLQGAQAPERIFGAVVAGSTAATLWAWAAAGGAALAGLDLLIDRWPEARHALERP